LQKCKTAIVICRQLDYYISSDDTRRQIQTNSDKEKTNDSATQFILIFVVFPPREHVIGMD